MAKLRTAEDAPVTPADRADYIRQILEETFYNEAGGNDPQTMLSDILGDLRHYAEANDIDFDHAVTQSASYWMEEREQ